MSVVDRALWVIERNSAGELNLPAVAEACGVSRSHLASAFGSTTGWPVMKYLRARRLTQAAQTLARGAPDILAVALDVGYGSHEAFTRAFRDQFGVPPERVRERASTEGLALVAPLDLRARERPVLAPPWLPKQQLYVQSGCRVDIPSTRSLVFPSNGRPSWPPFDPDTGLGGLSLWIPLAD